jgi:hypothetical protein
VNVEKRAEEFPDDNENNKDPFLQSKAKAPGTWTLLLMQMRSKHPLWSLLWHGNATHPSYLCQVLLGMLSLP